MRNVKRSIIALILAIAVILSLGMLPASARTVNKKYITELESAGFPHDYAVLLEELHYQHPKWTFSPLVVGADFDTVIEKESRDGYSLLSSDDAYPLLLAKKNGDYIHTDGRFVEATDLAISYFIDPRNFLKYDREMFQFLDLRYPTYIKDDEIVESMKSLIANSEKNTENKLLDAVDPDTKVTYAEDIVNLCKPKVNNINPFYIVAKIYQEVGKSSTGTAVSGKAFKYDGVSYPAGYYNYFNIGATSGSNAVYRGLKRAYDKGWNTRYKSIKGGIEFIATSYTGKGQYTSYLTKFNVNPDGEYPMYSHQYMSNLVDPAASASTIYKGYVEADILDNVTINFVIPVFKNMPTFEETSIKLNDSSNSLKGTLDTFTIREENSPSAATIVKLEKGAALTVLDRQRTVGMRDTTGKTSRGINWSQVEKPFWYKVKYGNGATGWTMFENADVTATVALTLGDSKTLGYKLTPTVSNTVRFASVDENIVSVDAKTGKITAKAIGTTVVMAYTATGSVDYVNVKVTKAEPKPEEPKPEDPKPVNPPPTTNVPKTLTSKTYSINSSTKMVSKIVPGTTVSKLVANLTEGKYVNVKVGNTTLKNSDIVPTGAKISIVADGKTVATYTAIIRGDINMNDGHGDGKVSIIDLLCVRDLLLGTKAMNDTYKVSADLNSDGRISIIDLLSVRDILLG